MVNCKASRGSFSSQVRGIAGKSETIASGNKVDKQSEVEQDTRVVKLGYTGKRAFDLVVASIGLLIFGPVILLIALAVRMTSPGPAFIRQTRVGRYRKLFICYKLRSMHEGTEEVATHEVPPDAITDFGGWLRRTRLDELPQLWNVLKGDMSLVGPRPCLPVQTQVVAARLERDIYQIRPGITGPAQVQGLDMARPEEMAESDQTYMQTATFWQDVRLVFQTLIACFSRNV